MNKYFVIGFFVLVFFAGVGVIMSNASVSFGDLMESLGEMNPRLMGLLALPFIALLFVLGVYLHRKNEERKWKQALLRTRAKKRT